MLSNSERASYYKLYSSCGLEGFSPRQGAEVLGINKKYSKKLLYRLKENFAAVRIGWGSYSLVEPAKLAGVLSILFRFRMESKVFLRVMGPHLNELDSVLIYGSWARGDVDKGSDIDILIGGPHEVIRTIYFKIQKEHMPSRLNIELFSPENFGKLQFKEALLIYFASKEGVVGFGDASFDRVKQRQFTKKEILDTLDENLDFLAMNREILEISPSRYASGAVIYSSTLRLRLTYLINCFLENKMPLKDELETLLPLNEKLFSRIYGIYRLERDGKPCRKRVTRGEVLNYIDMIGEYVKETKIGVQCRKRKG